MFILRLVALSILVTGCLRSDLVECGDRACPLGTLCDLVHATCVDPKQILACDGIATGDRCTYAGLIGTCIDGTCFEPRCGDHVITGVEVCDDGNRASGDGCAADCESAEVCGDGAYEVARGEECDDGNSRSGDTCSSTCRAEAITSTVRQCGHPRGTGLAVFDRARGQLVRLDGTSGAPYRTFTWDGTWSCGPDLPLTKVASAAYDVARERVVVLGTRDGQKLVEEWDGVTWSERTTARTDASLVYDPANARFLGYDISDVDHVSVWDSASNTWTTLTAAGSTRPTSQLVVRSAFDESRSDFILQVLVSLNVQTWAFQTSTLSWRRLADGPGGFAAAMTYDASRSQVVGCNNSTLYGLDAAGAWTAVPNLTGTISCGSLAYDPVIPRILALDGLTNSYSVWTLDANTWTEHAPIDLAPLRTTSIVAVPSLGGVLGLNLNGETAVWNGQTWTPGPQSPPWVASPTLAYDPTREVAVGFDGTNMAELASGGVWQSVTTNTVTNLRAMIYDPSRGALIAMSSTGALYVRSGTVWQPFDVPLPSGSGVGIAFDPFRQRLVAIVMAGLRYVYELDGSTWIEIFALTSNYVLVPLSVRGSLVFVTDSLNGSWERKGDVWLRFDSMLPESPLLLADDPIHGEALAVLSGRELFGVGYHSATPPESCIDGEDVDGDGHTGCDDDDCWWRCP